ncbi:hypothetical protein [Clostridium saccharoperbutylacetonicum]|uniref:hypothetical protein n=1 Tax=Clostridium saccharoperbutylacetonicum TaxID=36745 RepID=UPI000983E767|nr:hypothetical protein [Clostridium saccharoperbutylacetonicum]AQR95617.1 hypothetical protein CLSAP_29330 [Clostridium saccharoperbutylacetonicum]NSB31478.1 hypothetical protein [Clostridium saccharoperbutylacetonicum]
MYKYISVNNIKGLNKKSFFVIYFYQKSINMDDYNCKNLLNFLDIKEFVSQ